MNMNVRRLWTRNQASLTIIFMQRAPSTLTEASGLFCQGSLSFRSVVGLLSSFVLTLVEPLVSRSSHPPRSPLCFSWESLTQPFSSDLTSSILNFEHYLSQYSHMLR